jgi:hypothetical protein
LMLWPPVHRRTNPSSVRTYGRSGPAVFCAVETVHRTVATMGCAALSSGAGFPLPLLA